MFVPFFIKNYKLATINQNCINMSKNFYFVIALLFNYIAFSQSSSFSVDSNPDTGFKPIAPGVYKMTTDTNDVKDLYYFKSFDNTSVIEFSGKSYKINNLNVDITNNNFVSQVANDSLFVFSNLDKAFINNKEFIKKDNSIYEVLVNGNKITLEIKNLAVLRDEIIDRLTGKPLQPKKYILKKEYIINNKQTESISSLRKLKKKSILSFINKKYKKEVLDFSKKQKLSFKDEKDLKKILNYYNSL